ncbi:putative arginine N-methyltransferase [Xylariaceae sp. FL0255]|nr:putative arginine N-methyltransferase [Xylariaceae sp. FL0255]
MPDDTLETRIPPSSPASISQILYLAWHHDLAGLQPFLSVPGRASVQEPTTGETPLHAAIRSCSASASASNTNDEPTAVDLEAAKAVVHELFLSGAIWNDVDNQNETPGCLAARLGQTELYNLCVEAGMRAELLFGLLDGYEELESDGEEEEEDDDDDAEGEKDDANREEGNKEEDGDAPEDIILESDPDRAFKPPQPTDPNVTSESYLRANLTYSDGKLVDDAQNGVMMAWETSIMRSSVDALLPGLAVGKRVLNIGYGMGIIDAMFFETHPSKHHIIEAHPEVLKHIAEPDSKVGKEWEKNGPAEGAYKVHAGRWQDVVPQLIEQGELYDAIYFDTFGEDYSQLRMFFTEYVPAILDDSGVFGFFNGLGADRKVCYDVYTKVVEMHLADGGLDVEWKEFDVDMKGLEEEGKGEWHGVKRRYWTLDKYRLPIITFMG